MINAAPKTVVYADRLTSAMTSAIATTTHPNVPTTGRWTFATRCVIEATTWTIFTAFTTLEVAFAFKTATTTAITTTTTAETATTTTTAITTTTAAITTTACRRWRWLKTFNFRY